MVFALVFTGCEKDVEEAQPVNISLQLAVDEGEVWFDVPYEKAEITLINKGNGVSLPLTADEQGKVVLTGLAPGTYDVNVSLTIKAEEYTALTGVYRESDFFLNYSLTDQPFFSDDAITITLIASEPVGGFVIKQIYYAGSDTKKAALNRDNFIEIYNNSDEVLYADSLIIGLAYGKASRKLDDYSLPNNQFDWSKSVGMDAVGDANEDYIYAKGLFMVPSDGTGKKYPVQPGHSIILAGTAVNHGGGYTDAKGVVQKAEDPTLTVDLSGADFEVWFYDYDQRENPGRTPLASDVDNPDVPNMEVIFATSMRDMYFPPQARESFVLLKGDGRVNFAELKGYAPPITRTISTSTTLYPQVPAKFILDAVELEAPVASDVLPRRLPQRFDAGAISVPGGPYSSQSVVRRTLKIVNGRRILQDTNNSTKDFGVLNRANVSKSADSFMD